jgi:hypothetical protein
MEENIKVEVNNLLCKKDILLSKEELIRIIQVSIINGLIDITYYSKHSHVKKLSTDDELTNIIMEEDECTIYLEGGGRILITSRENDEENNK